MREKEKSGGAYEVHDGDAVNAGAAYGDDEVAMGPKKITPKTRRLVKMKTTPERKHRRMDHNEEVNPETDVVPERRRMTFEELLFGVDSVPSHYVSRYAFNPFLCMLVVDFVGCCENLFLFCCPLVIVSLIE